MNRTRLTNIRGLPQWCGKAGDGHCRLVRLLAQGAAGWVGVVREVREVWVSGKRNRCRIQGDVNGGGHVATHRDGSETLIEAKRHPGSVVTAVETCGPRA